MSENKESDGQIQIADEVIAVIAGTAAMEVDGIVDGVGGVAGYPAAVMEFFGKKNQARGVKVLVEDNQVTLDINIVVLFGTKVQVAAAEVQTKVKSAVETMTGLEVSIINVTVVGIVKERVAKAQKNEMEEE